MLLKNLTVSQLTLVLKQLLEESLNLETVWIQGEISNFTKHSSGHLYFTLKDQTAKIACVMFRGEARTLKFQPIDGMAVSVKARLSIYEKSGQYQLYISQMKETGQGDLYLAFEKLKAKLNAEGLFLPERKRALPFLPARIGLITSPTGAAVQDMIKIIQRRSPKVDLLVIPVKVQGVGASESLVEALLQLKRLDLDLAIIGRGGGSLEELTAFNDEAVARAIATAWIPIISAVGHETDFTIADFVADLRAPTPSAAAELAVPDEGLWRRNLFELQERFVSIVLRNFKQLRCELVKLNNRRVWKLPQEKLWSLRQDLDLMEERLQRISQQTLTSQQEKFFKILAKLNTLSPLATLERGYAILQQKDGLFLKDAKQVVIGEKLKVTLAAGIIYCEVLSNENGDETGERGRTNL